MIPKPAEKQKAIELRQKGLSYDEILASIPVAKSTLSLWLRSVHLAKRQKQRLTERKRLAQIKGAQARHNQRLESSKVIISEALNEIGEISERELKLIGAALYWAEGSKQKEHMVSQRVIFANSDPFMIITFLHWLQLICKINFHDLIFELYIHESGDINRAKIFWINLLKISADNLRVYFKKHKITKRRNIDDYYIGLIRISVRQSTDLNRKISGWIEGIYKKCGVV